MQWSTQNFQVIKTLIKKLAVNAFMTSILRKTHRWEYLLEKGSGEQKKMMVAPALSYLALTCLGFTLEYRRVRISFRVSNQLTPLKNNYFRMDCAAYHVTLIHSNNYVFEKSINAMYVWRQAAQTIVFRLSRLCPQIIQSYASSITGLLLLT